MKSNGGFGKKNTVFARWNHVDGDFVATFKILSFGANENTETIWVTINGDTK